jgi:outer membrane lipoprotein-sorting protein
MASVGHRLFLNDANELPKKVQELDEDTVRNENFNEFLLLSEKFMRYRSLSFDFEYTIYTGDKLNEIAEHYKGKVWKLDSLYKMIDAYSELVVDSLLSVSLDHDNKNIMITWSSMMDRRYHLHFDMKELAEESEYLEIVSDLSNVDKRYKTFKIRPKNVEGYYLIDIDSVSGFPKRIEIYNPSEGMDNFDQYRVVIEYRNMNSEPISPAEFSYTNYFDNDPELRVSDKYKHYDLLTNM